MKIQEIQKMLTEYPNDGKLMTKEDSENHMAYLTATLVREVPKLLAVAKATKNLDHSDYCMWAHDSQAKCVCGVSNVVKAMEELEK